LLLLAGIGIAVRIGWILLFPAPFRSDGSVYFTLARQLSELGTYRDPRGEFAFWPPGYPFYLLPFIKAFGAHHWVPIIANFALYVGSLFVVYDLARRCGGSTAPRLATLIAAAWPNYIFASGTASKELLLVTLVPLALLLYFRASDAVSRIHATGLLALSGAVFALASLTQPGLLLLPSILIGYEMTRRTAIGAAAIRVGLVVGVLAILIGLWTYRNFVVLGSAVLISTNGGSTFYRANNPLATGGYTERGERSLDGLGELERHRRGLEYGTEWIRSHPMDFLKLAWRKQVLFLGDDGEGVYETLKRGLEIGDARYFWLKMVSNLFWLVAWLLILAGFIRGGGASAPQLASTCALGLTVAYFWLIDSVFESGARHHMPLIGILAVLAAIGHGVATVGRPRRVPPDATPATAARSIA
jgi:4-amino-4-deoxy-L-arabinose transferase-like glycosyltransferase